MMVNPKTIIDASVVTANYNNGPFLADFFESFISSSYQPKELIFINDGSTDNSIEIANFYKNTLPYLKVIDLKRNVGFANSLNIGLQASTGKYIARIDPDDILTSNRLEAQYSFLEANPNVSVLGSQALYFNSDNKEPIGSTNMPEGHKNIFQAYLNCDNGVLHGTTMFRRECIDGILYRQEQVPSEDYDFFGRIIRSRHIFANSSEALTLVRIHTNSVSNNIAYSTIDKVHKLREEIFSIRRSSIFVFTNYMTQKFYRKYLYCKPNPMGFLYLFIAIIFSPQKVYTRLKKLSKRTNI